MAAMKIQMNLSNTDILANKIGKEIQGTSYYLIDIGIAGEQLVLQAQELGLGTCWIGSFDADKVRQALEIPSDVAIIELMTLGYPAEKGGQNTRLPIEEIVCYNKWRF